jgi:amino-acid N-acetyltransferase
MQTTIRQATESDIEGILSIVNYYAAQNLMLPRTADQVRRVLGHFLVAMQDEAVVGCGSLVQLTPHLTELRSLAVAPSQRGTGLGRRLVEALVERARSAGYDQLCALTLQEGFFNNLGFATVDRWAVSPKIWTECIYCPKFDHCDEIAVLMNLTESETVPTRLGHEVGLGLWQQLRAHRLVNR